MNRYTRAGRAALRQPAKDVVILCEYFDDPDPPRVAVRPGTCATCQAAIRVSLSSPPGRTVCFACVPDAVNLQQPLPQQIADIEAATGVTIDPEEALREASAELARRLVTFHQQAGGRS